MSFLAKFKPGSTASSPVTTSTKRDPNAPQPTALDKHIADIYGPPRQDGSDKFFGFENYGSTCYCNSIIQCLYYSAPFRENVIDFPSTAFLEEFRKTPPAKKEEPHTNGAPISPRVVTSGLATPYPNPTSPARKPATTTTVNGSPQKPEDSKDSPEYKKKIAIQTGPVLEMTQDKSEDYGMDESLFSSLKDIFAAIIANKSRTGVVSPHKFLEILRRENEMFRSAMHQDAHEFLNLLLNSVVEKVEQFSKQHAIENGEVKHGGQNGVLAKVQTPTFTLDPRWVHDIFEGLLTSETRCLTCETVSQRDEAFLDLSVDLDPHTSVTSCLRKFSQEEMLCERNKFHCDNCGGLQEAEKRMKIKRLPRILALHLKRFKYTEDLQRLQKLFHRVSYPFHLRLFNTTDDADDSDRLYELYAVVVHIGGGPYHGHYVSIVKTQDRGWLLFDDELVEPVDKSYVMQFFGGEPVVGSQDARQLACAYVLFYQETTLEAVLREEEADGRTEPAPTSAPVEVDAKETKKSMEASTLLGLTTPSSEISDQMDSLNNTVTRSTDTHDITSPLSPTTTDPLSRIGTTPSKSKKELKAEEKEKKAAQKAEEKALNAKRKEESDRRVEAIRKQEEETKKALELSKQSAVEEAKKRGDEPMNERTGLSRFTRPGSMSLKGRPRMFGALGKDKDKDREKDGAPVPALPAADDPALTALPVTSPPLPAVEELVKESKEKKNRFSIGRKKSANLA